MYIFIYLYVLHHRQRRSRILPYPSVSPATPLHLHVELRCVMLRYVCWPCCITFTNISLAYRTVPAPVPVPTPAPKHMPDDPSF